MAFSVSVKSPMSKPERISRSLGLFAGQITISSYATTLVECTAITKYFKPISHTNATAALFPKGVVSCVPSAISESGFAFRWDATTGAFRVYYPTEIVMAKSSAANAVVQVVGAALACTSAAHTVSYVGAEANANDAVGKVDFVAIGFI